MKPNKSELYSYLLAATSPSAVGLGIAVSGALVRYPVFSGQAIRYAIGAVMLGVLGRKSLHTVFSLSRREVLKLLLLSATGLAGFSVCSIEALRSSSPAAVGVIIGCLPIVLALVVPILNWRRPKPRTFIAAAIVSVGAAVVNGAGHSSFHGAMWALGALVGDACFSIIGVSLIEKLGARALSFWATVLATVGLLAVGAAVGGSTAFRTPTLNEAEALLYSGVAISFYAVGVWYVVLKRISVERAGLLTGLIPVSALIGQAILGIGVVNLREVIGVVIVTLGISAGIIAGDSSEVAPKAKRGNSF